MTPEERLDELLRGENPRLVARLGSGFVELAQNQFLAGYCILLAYPKAGQLLDLDEVRRVAFLSDMATVGQAIREATGAARCNFAIYGNVDPFLHAHIWPRFEDEDESLRTLPPLSFPVEVRESCVTAFDQRVHSGIQRAIAARLVTDWETD